MYSAYDDAAFDDYCIPSFVSDVAAYLSNFVVVFDMRMHNLFGVGYRTHLPRHEIKEGLAVKSKTFCRATLFEIDHYTALEAVCRHFYMHVLPQLLNKIFIYCCNAEGTSNYVFLVAIEVFAQSVDVCFVVLGLADEKAQSAVTIVECSLKGLLVIVVKRLGGSRFTYIEINV
eukprot:6182415-Prymnesium_polylepis.1